MTRVLRIALASMCAGLVLVIATELFPMTGQQALAPPHPSDTKTVEIGVPVPALDWDAMAAEILERPLFSPARRPPASVAHVEEVPERTPPPLRGRLAGVMIGPGVREALFVRAGQKPVAVKVGNQIDGWKVASIEPDRVILSSAFGTLTVKPTLGAPAAPPPVSAIDTGLGPPESRVPAAKTAVARGNPDDGVELNIMLNPFRGVARPRRQGVRK